MEIYHEVWLLKNQHRSREWLKEKLKDGFDIHHMDGDHSNNDADNLVLIEHADHMMLHGMTVGLGRLSRSGTKKKTIETMNTLGRYAYEQAILGRNWVQIKKDFKPQECKNKLARYAKRWAINNNLKWPTE